MLDNPPTAALLPGQGNQAPGWHDTVAGARPDLPEAALALAGDDPFERSDESTRYAQPGDLFGAAVAA